MNAIRSSGRQKHPSRSPPHPIFGALTGSKSQLSLQRNRSICLRSGPLSRTKPSAGLHRSPSPPMGRGTGKRQQSSYCEDNDTLLVKDLCKKTKLNMEASTADDDELLHILIKDLRARRVYSPQSAVDTCSKEDGVDSSCRDQKIADLGFVESSDCGKEDSKVTGEIDELGKGISSESQNEDEINSILCSVLNEYRFEKESDMYIMGEVNEETEVPDAGFSCKAYNFDRVNLESSGGESSKLQDQNDGGNSLEKIDDSNGELVLTTPPFAEICGNLKAKENEEKREEGVRVKDTHLSGSAEENAGPKDKQRKDSVLKSKSVLRPRFQGKLFKAPCSVSYRRLFPFLKNIMGDDSGAPELGHYQKDEKVMDELRFQLPLFSQSQEALSHACDSGASTVDAVMPIQVDAKEVASECLSVSSVNDKCLRESKTDPEADFHCVKNVANALHKDEFREDSENDNGLSAYAKANCGDCSSEQDGVLNEECVLKTPPDVELCGSSEVNVARVESVFQDVYQVQVKAMDLIESTPENSGEGFCLETYKRKESFLKSKSVPRPHLQKKLFKIPGSFSYRRLLPFLMEFTEYNSDSGPKQVKSDSSVNNILADPSNELSGGNQPKLSFSQVLLDAKEVVHECLSAPSVNEHLEKVDIGSEDKPLSDSKVDMHSVMVDCNCVKNVANALCSDGFKQVKNKKSRQHNSESPPKAQNLQDVNPNVCNLTFEHHSSKEKGFTIDSDERKQFLCLEKHESVSRYPLEGQSQNDIDPNMLGAENETSSHANSRSDDASVVNHVRDSNDEPRPTSDKIIIEKPDMAGHNGGNKAGSVAKGIVYGPGMPSKGSNNKNAGCVGEIRNGSESKTALVLNRCSRIKLLKHDGSFNYKRLLPFLLNTTKDNSCVSVNDHYSKLQKFSGSQVTPISYSNGCIFPMEHCTGTSGTQQQPRLLACDDSLNNDSSRAISSAQTPGFQSSRDSSKVIQLQDKQIVLNRHSKLESSPDLQIPITPKSPTINEVITREDEPTIALSQSSLYSEVRGDSSFLISSNGEKLLETDGCCKNLSQLKASEQLSVPAVGFKKGILKRNPRGCRGLCTCLNCVSFRLHAERAFEFSRNQLLDAEELSQGLIKELSHLRNMLEKSTESVNGHSVFDGNHVKEACRKAFATEKHAKYRLSQMNDDLNIHCRISNLQRPRVRFADQ